MTLTCYAGNGVISLLPSVEDQDKFKDDAKSVYRFVFLIDICFAITALFSFNEK